MPDPSMLAKPAAVAAAALLSSTLMVGRASALSQDIGNISCDVITDYGATSPAYFEVFQSYLEGYLAGEKGASKLDRDAPTLMTAVIEYCKISRDASFAAAVAAVAKP